MADMLYNGVVGVKLEAVKGTKETITAADCDILAFDAKFDIKPTVIKRNPFKMGSGKVTSAIGGKSAAFTFKVEMKGSGTVGTAPSWTKLLQCCRFRETALAGAYNDYDPKIAVGSTPTCTMKIFFADGFSRTAYGCRGSWKFTGKSNEIPMLELEMIGVFDSETLESPPDVDYDESMPVVMINTGIGLYEYNTDLSSPLPPDVSTAAVCMLNRATGTALNTKMARSFANSVNNWRPRFALLYMKLNSAPAAGKVLTAAIHANNVGSPAAAAITNGTANTVVATWPWADGEFVLFEFATPPTLTVDTFWLVLTTDYAASDTVNVSWLGHSCLLAAQTCKQYTTGAWVAVSLVNFTCFLAGAVNLEMILPGIDIDGGAKKALRTNVAAPQGWDMGRVTTREIIATIEPEKELSSYRDIYGYLDDMSSLLLYFKVGSGAGDLFELWGLWCQVEDWGSLGNKEDVISEPIKLAFNQSPLGDDDLRIRCR